MFLQNRVDNAALHSDAPAVNDADFPVAFEHRLIQIFLDQICYFPWQEWVQVYCIFQLTALCNRNASPSMTKTIYPANSLVISASF
jgi:hypothetical protein